MARYDVYRRPGSDALLVDLQTDLISIYDTRVIAPLVPAAQAHPVTGHLNPLIAVDDADYILYVQLLGVVPHAALGAPSANVAAQSDRITRALDMLFQGF